MPVLDEAPALPALLSELRAVPLLFERVIFVDNGSTDGGPDIIRAAGGRVVWEPRRGYGYACLAGVAAARVDLEAARRRFYAANAPGVAEAATSTFAPVPTLAFMEGDGSDDPMGLPRILGPVLSGDADLMVGSRRRAVGEGAAMPPHQRWGNQAAALGMRALFGIRLPDNGPFRAIRLDLLLDLGMEPRGYAWTTEMVVKAKLAGARLAWVDTAFRARAGRSKISGSLRGTVGAFRGIFGTLVRLRVRATLGRQIPGSRPPASPQ